MIEIDKNPPEITRKLWNTVRILLYMMRKNIARSKILMVDLHMLLKKGKIASKAKAIGYLSYYSVLICRSSSISKSFISPRDYEFSCSNTPLYPSKRKKYHRQPAQDDQLIKVLGILNSYDSDVMEASSPPLPSPSYVMNNKDDRMEINNSGQVDKDAEEFINKFYKDLTRQKILAALESPSPLYDHHLYID